MTQNALRIAQAIARGRRNMEATRTLSGIRERRAQETVRPYARAIAAEIFAEMLEEGGVREWEREEFYRIASEG